MTAPPSRVFRKAALDRLADPEQLDEALRIVRPRDLLAVLGLVALVASGGAWMYLGQIRTVVPGSGLFAPGDGSIVQITAPGEGSLSSLLVAAGQEVTAGAPIARINQPERLLELEQARAAVTEIEAGLAQRMAQIGERARAREERLAARRAVLVEQIAAAERRVAAQSEQLARDEELLSRGLIIRRAVQDSRQLLDDARQALLDFRAELVALEAERLTAAQQDDLDRRALAEELRQRRERLSQLDLRAREQQTVVAPAPGRVTEILVRPGERVAGGARIAVLETGSAPVRLVAYVPPETGKSIAPGMEVLVVPSTVRRDETGGLLARVVSVSAAPVSPQAMIAVLGNESLLPRLAPQGAPFEVVIALDRAGPDALPVWAAGRGPAIGIDSGTLATAEITVRVNRPAELVLPALRALFTGGGR